MILVYLGRWSYGRFKDANNIFYKMKNDLITGTWQDDFWCPIIIILFCTSDAVNTDAANCTAIIDAAADVSAADADANVCNGEARGHPQEVFQRIATSLTSHNNKCKRGVTDDEDNDSSNDDK